MQYAFKGFFNTPQDAEYAYYELRKKGIIHDLEISDLTTDTMADIAPQAAYAYESPNIYSNLGQQPELPNMNNTISDSRVIMMPFLNKAINENRSKEQKTASGSFYLYGHCHEKDLEAVNSCLRRYGATSVLSTALERTSRFHR